MVIDLDATLLDAHSDKHDATRTWKKGFGFHPLLSFVDHRGSSGGEPAAQLLRPGKAGSNTAADHIVVLDAALAQLPGALRARDETDRVRGAGPHRRRRRRRGPRRIRRAARAPPNMACRSNPATAPGSPKPPA